MRQRLMLVARAPLFWPLEVMADMGYVPSLAVCRAFVAADRAWSFVLAAVLFPFGR